MISRALQAPDSEGVSPIHDASAMLAEAEAWAARAHGMRFAPALGAVGRMGRHAMRKAGVGETFWQYRAWTDSDPISLVDWRRSARASRWYVREREAETSRLMLVWRADSLAMAMLGAQGATRARRAATLAAALAAMTLNGGERVEALASRAGASPRGASARRRHIAETLARGDGAALPPARLSASSRALVVVVGDFLCEPEAFGRALARLGATGGVAIQTLLADEVAFPFRGRALFAAPDGSARLEVGRAESLREAYLSRLAQHRTALARQAARAQFGFMRWIIDDNEANRDDAILAQAFALAR